MAQTETGAPSEEQFGKRASGGLEPIRKKKEPPVPSQEPVVEYDTPTAPAPPKVNPTLADRAIIASMRTKNLFTDSVSNNTIYHLPDTTVYNTTVKQDAVVTEMTNQLTEFFAQIYGNEYMAQMVAAENLPEPQRAKTYAALKYLSPDIGAGTLDYYKNPGQLDTTGISREELIKQVIADPTSVQTMSDAEKVALSSVAEELASTLEQMPESGLAGQFKKALYIGLTGDVSVALDEDEKKTIEQVVKNLRGLNIGGTTEEQTYAPGRDVGIDQVRQLGQGVIVLDIEDAKADPVQAFAVKTYLEQNYPDLEIQYGREGIVGSLIDKVSIPLDYITAPAGGALQQAGELGDLSRTPAQRKALSGQADAIEKAIKENDQAAYAVIRKEFMPFFELAGGVDPEKEQPWQEEAARAVIQIRDYASEDVGWNEYVDQTVANTRPKTIGFGFADSFTAATDTLPGDAWYNPAYISSGLLAALVFDPVNWAPGLLGGIKAAKLIPKMTRAKYEKMVLAGADELLSMQKPLREVVDYETGLGKALAKMGPSEVAMETAFSREAAIEAAKKGLEGVVSGDAWYPIVGRGFVKNAVYRKLARFPEELVYTRPFHRAVTRLNLLKEAVGEKEMFAAIARWSGQSFRRGGGTETAKMISQAVGEEDMGLSLMTSVVGLDRGGLSLDNIASEIEQVTRLPESTYRTERLAHLNDVFNGREFVRPMQQIFSAKQLRQLERTAHASHGVFGKAWQGVIGFTENFPGNLFRWTEQNPLPNGEFATQTRQMFVSIDNMYKPTGFGELMVLPHAVRQPGILRSPAGRITVYAAEDTFNNLADIGRTLGLPDRRINEIMGGWSDLIDNPSAARGYDFLTEARTRMIDESPVLPQFAKKDLKRMWGERASSDTSPGWLTLDNAGDLYPSPIVYEKILDPGTHKVTKIGKPVIEADQLTVWREHSLADWREYMSLTQRTMKQWEKAGWTRRSIAGMHHAVTMSWAAVNNFWRTTTLGARLFGALPGRILGEEMLRMAAYDYASAVWHPLEWWHNTKWGISDEAGFTALFREHPGSALGVMMDNVERGHPGFAQIKAGRETVTPASGQMFYRSIAERMGRYQASPSTHYWHLPNLGDTEATLAEMSTGKHASAGADWLRTYAEYRAKSVASGAEGLTDAQAIERTHQELQQLIGTGEGSEFVRTAIRRGEATIDGKNYRVGTTDFAEKLEDLATSDRWEPGLQFTNRSAGDYLPIMREGGIRRFTDRLFKTFYTAPDVALARSDMWRQMATREFRNLLGKGYRPATARKLAEAYAARGTSEMMFTIGAKTSGEMFLKNINPFFPAYRELATTWLKRIPLRIGEGHWALGEVALARRADIWMDFFTQMGWVQHDEQGQSFVPLPFLKPIVRLLTGIDANFNVTAAVEGFAGILPMPIGITGRDEEGNLLPLSQRVKGIFPTLGGPSAFVLGLLNDILPTGKMGELAEDWLTLYGADSSLGPLSVDRFFEAFGTTMPWMTNTTQQYHEDTRTWAMIDGARAAWPEMVKEFGDPDSLSDADKLKFAEEWQHRAERYATVTYLIRSVAGATLPFSIQIEDEGKKDMGLMWAFLNSLPKDDNGDFQSNYIKSVLATYPQYGPYMAGKTLDTRLTEDPTDSLADIMDAVGIGDIKVRTYEDWQVFALGMNSISHLQAKRNAILGGGQGTIAEQMMDFDAQVALDELKLAEDYFLDSTTNVDTWGPQQSQSFKDMYNAWLGYKDIRDGKTTPKLTLEQYRILRISEVERDFSKYFSPNPETSEQYYKLKDEVYKALDYEPTSDFGKAQQWYFAEVQEGYYDQRDKLFKKDMQAQDWQDLRDLANKYDRPFVNPDHPEWGQFPSPEMYSFIKLKPKDQERQVTEWAALPGYFLTEFQREQVGYTISEDKQNKANQLANFVTKNEIEFDAAVEKYNISPASDTYQINRDNYDKSYAQRAKKLGLEDYWAEQNAPQYVRIGNALNLSDQTATWNLAVQKVHQLTNVIESTPYEDDKPPYTQFYSVKGSSDVAIANRGYMNDAVRQWRKNDAEFDRIIGELQVWMGEEGRPLTQEDLVNKLFFDYVPWGS